MPHKLLLADDSVTIQRVIELTFADEDVEVFAVGDGKKAIEAVQASRPDIVLADVGMPERDGYEVAAFIKSNPELAHIPVLLLTGAFEPIDETRARAVGCDGVLVKPFEPQMVINRVKDLLAGRRPAGLWSANPAAQTPSRASAQAGTDFDSRATATAATAPAVPMAVAAGTGAGAGGSLEDYFDRLDAAFAGLDGAPASAPAASAPAPSMVMPAPSSPSPFHGDDLAGWDPDLTGDPTRPAPLEPPPIEIDPQVFSAPAPARPARPTPLGTPPQVDAPPASSHASPAYAPAPSAPALPMPSLAEAFVALLSAEQNIALTPSGIRPAGDGGVSESMVEDITRRVVARMTDHAVKITVVEVAERLVREEIERIKGR